MYYLLAALLINVLQGVLNFFYWGDAAWHLYDITNQVTIILALLFSFSQISYKSSELKRVCFSAIVFFTFNLFDYIAKMFDVSYYFAVPLLILTLVTFFMCWRRTGADIKKTPPKGCFIAYKAPSDLLSLIWSFVSKPYGHCFLVVDNKKFCYTKGVLEENVFHHKAGYVYKSIGNVPLENARRLVGNKWSLKGNCFVTFEGLSRRAGKRQHAK